MITVVLIINYNTQHTIIFSCLVWVNFILLKLIVMFYINKISRLSNTIKCKKQHIFFILNCAKIAYVQHLGKNNKSWYWQILAFLYIILLQTKFSFSSARNHSSAQLSRQYRKSPNVFSILKLNQVMFLMFSVL